MWKQADSVGSATPDGTKSQAAATPSAPVVVANKPAPGQTGPKGLSPRTTYSRVNTGPSPAPDIGAQAKLQPPRGLESLPKLAQQENSMAHETMQARPSIQELVKSAMEGTLSRASIFAEGARQQGLSVTVAEKTASAATDEEHIPTETCEKYASALEYLSAKLAADPGSLSNASPGVGPGQGPGALTVTESNRTDNNIEAGQTGQAKEQPPKSPGFENDPGKSSDPTNAMATNDAMQHPAQSANPLGNATASNAAQKEASALAASNLAVLQKLAGGKPAGALKTAAVLEASNLAILKKLAEDAINPAQISAGAASSQGAEAPSGVSASEEGPVPPKPSPANTQASLVGSNQAAIDYTKRDAKANMRADMGNLLNEPMQSASGDNMLQSALSSTPGAKIASQQLVKTAAAHALLLKLAQQQEAEKKNGAAKKEKTSNMGGTLTTAQGQSGFSAASM